MASLAQEKSHRLLPKLGGIRHGRLNVSRGKPASPLDGLIDPIFKRVRLSLMTCPKIT